MLRLLGTLTTRGRFLGGLGVLVLLSGTVLGQRDLLRLGLLLVAVAVFGALSLRLAPDSIRLRRTITPGRVTVATEATVHIRIMNPSRSISRLQCASERLPHGLGPSPRFMLDRLGPGEHVTVHYRLQPQTRGAYELGPLSLELRDGLGMARIVRAYPETDRIIALPQVHRLAGTPSTHTHQGSGESEHRSSAAFGDYDVSTREYRQGDDLRRVHWRSTARRGELMVRREEQPREQVADVLLDARLAGHRGEGAACSLEWAVTAAASVCEHLGNNGFAVRLVLDGHDDGWAAADDLDARELVLDRLALLRPGQPHCLVDAIDLVAREPMRRQLVAILGEVEAPQIAPLAQLGAGVALLMAPATWTELPMGLAERLTHSSSAAADSLAQAGWRTAFYAPSVTVPQAWSSLQPERSRL